MISEVERPVDDVKDQDKKESFVTKQGVEVKYVLKKVKECFDADGTLVGTLRFYE